MMQPTLKPEEKTKWDADEWTPEGTAHMTPKDVAEGLGVSIGRAGTIIAQCKAGAAQTDEIELALSGDASAILTINRAVQGLPYVVLRNGKPDPIETRALVASLKANPARRTTWKGLLIVAISDVAKSSTKLPRCPITGRVLDDFDGKLLDGETGADWAPLWIERGNGRALWIAHAPRHLLPAYASSDPVRVVAELSGPTVPMQWQRIEIAWNIATSVERAAAEERLFKGLNPVTSAPVTGEACAATVDGRSCPGYRGACANYGQIGKCGQMVLGK